jgi:hypothetical protein
VSNSMEFGSLRLKSWPRVKPPPLQQIENTHQALYPWKRGGQAAADAACVSLHFQSPWIIKCERQQKFLTTCSNLLAIPHIWQVVIIQSIFGNEMRPINIFFSVVFHMSWDQPIFSFQLFSTQEASSYNLQISACPSQVATIIILKASGNLTCLVQSLFRSVIKNIE